MTSHFPIPAQDSPSLRSRLWSLYEMLKFNGHAFFHATAAMSRSREIINAWEKDSAANPGAKEIISADTRTGLLRTIKMMVDSLAQIGATVSLMEARRLQFSLNEEPWITTYVDFRDSWLQIESRMRDELTLTQMFIVDPKRREYFDSPLRFGQDVSDKLPDAIPDIEDAGRCLALNQGTAAVFHLMRVMEVALKSLARLLGIPYAPSWESYINQIEKCINEKHKRKTIKWKRDEPFYREILGNLQTIKIAWRNPTMHVVRRYSADEAEEVYIAVRAFLKRIATRLPPPKAKLPIALH